jgi:hypothetical protein
LPVDPAPYGAAAAAVPARFNRSFAVNIGRRLGFFEGELHQEAQRTFDVAVSA